ncbi:hypothetical protein AXA88_27525, partial [Salmonella enterica]|nr:hypothetical protein [Salmonella enterica]EAX3609559.1 hypothetical protein [Salmonella enterica]EGW6283110.1 hypothetical protein [Salmonella enterica]EGX3935524.1 hypothetical protein [Salmonella enterica]
NDPKWVRDDYSASNEGEKTENEDADDVNQNDDTVIQNIDSVNHSEPSADQIEPEVPETEPKSLQPEPVTKVADGVFDVSAKNADTSNQGEKAEITPLNNDDRTTEQAADSSQDSEPDHSLTPETESGTMLEMLLLIREISRNIQRFVDISQLILDSNQRIEASNLKTEKAQRK